jgi:hypothetical protein
MIEKKRKKKDEISETHIEVPIIKLIVLLKNIWTKQILKHHKKLILKLFEMPMQFKSNNMLTC